MAGLQQVGRRLALVGLAVGAGCYATSEGAPRHDESLAGRYRVAGAETDGRAYTGAVVIEGAAGPGAAYRIRWSIGRDHFEGTGRRVEPNRLSARFTSSGTEGGADYRIVDHDRLVGRWWSGDTATGGWETLRRMVDPWTPPGWSSGTRP